MWGQWQGAPNSEAPATSTPSAVQTASAHTGAHNNTATHPSGTHPPQELSDMLQMLGQTEPTSFEDLSMFNTFSE